jgi:hypothetical protein
MVLAVMTTLLVVGGKQRPTLFAAKAEWNGYERGVIINANTESGIGTGALDYVSPSQVCPTESPSILFKCATLENGKLYLCTGTEVMVYEVPEFRRTTYLSLPFFNDLHHVRPTPEGNLLVAVTGLDMVAEISPDGEVLREWSVTDEPTWERFSRSVDYRKVSTTKPHRAHPSYVFYLGGDVWVTRGDLNDAVSLTSPGRRIDIRVAHVHDGHLIGEYIYFTTVNGHIVVADTRTLCIEEDIDLNTFGSIYHGSLGWCRGLARVNDHQYWVGFTRIRHTKFKEKLLWVKHGAQCMDPPTRIALYDTNVKACVKEILVEPYCMSAIFSILDFGGETA